MEILRKVFQIEAIVNSKAPRLEHTWHVQETEMPGNSLAIQWLVLRASTAGGPGSIPGWGTKNLMPHITAKKENARVPRL